MSSASTTLFVDDAFGLLRQIRRRLKAIGYFAVELASNLEQAMEIVLRENVGRIVSDWQIQKEDGVSFLLDIKARNPELSCLLLTGFRGQLSVNQRSQLLEANIAICDKGDLDTAWLAELVEIDLTTTNRIESFDEGEGPIDDSIVTQGDALAIQNLKIDELEKRLRLVDEEKSTYRRAIKEVAADLIEELSRAALDRGSGNGQVLGYGSTQSLEGIVHEIENLTPEGLRLIELDRAVRRRLFGKQK